MQCSCGGLTGTKIVRKKNKVSMVYEECQVVNCGRVLLRPGSSLIGKTIDPDTNRVIE